MHRFAALLSAFFVLAVATGATAGPRIVTPRLVPPADGNIVCTASNASEKKEVQLQFFIYGPSGVLLKQEANTLAPNGSVAVSSSADSARHCAVEVVKGGKKNVRVSAYVIDVGNTPLVAVKGQ